MKPPKPISFILMHIAIICFIISVCISAAYCQCSSGMQKSSYDIYLNGSGNNSWGFSIPKFDPSKGTLIAVEINSVVSVLMNYQLSNEGAVPDVYKLLATRFDSISSTALTTPLTNIVSQNQGPFNLLSNQDTVGAGTVASPQFFSLMSAYSINDSITTSVAGFLGTGYLSFAYSPRTYISITSGSNYGISTTISDTMRLTFTYYYCMENLLALDIVNFAVNKSEENFAKINWDTQNETAGKTYDIEESTDRKTFHAIGSTPSIINNDNSNSSYVYNYAIPSDISGKLYFRLKEISANGNISYSEIKSIEIDNKNEAYVYPNPANNFINVATGQLATANWQADIFAANGQLVQKNFLGKCHAAQIIFIHVLPKGSYFLRLVNTDNYSTKTLSFVVL